MVVDIRSAGVNFPDVLIIQNLYQAKPALPFAPGAELAGVVSAVGPGVTNRRIGDRVIGSSTWAPLPKRSRCRPHAPCRCPISSISSEARRLS